MASKHEPQDIRLTVERCFISPNVFDSNGEPANLVDVVSRLASCVGLVANGIYPSANNGAEDSTGVYVSSLTEAVMGATCGLCRIADAIDNLAEAVRYHG